MSFDASFAGEYPSLNPWGQRWDPSDFRYGLAGTKFTDPSTGKRIRGFYIGVLADWDWAQKQFHFPWSYVNHAGSSICHLCDKHSRRLNDFATPTNPRCHAEYMNSGEAAAATLIPNGFLLYKTKSQNRNEGLKRER